jgi:ankyrin repeat protein
MLSRFWRWDFSHSTNLRRRSNFGWGRRREEGSLAVVNLQCGHYDAVRMLVGKGLDLSYVTAYGCNVLHSAAIGGNRDCIRLVVKKAPAIDVNLADDNGYTPIMIVLQKGFLDIANSLVQRGADLSIVHEGRNALNFAVMGGNRDCIRLVVKKAPAIDVNLASLSGVTPVMRVLALGFLDIAKSLVEIGADLSRVDGDGWNMLFWAVRGNSIDCIDWLLDETTLDINSVDNDGRNPFRLSFGYHKLEMAKHLVTKGANLFLKDNNGLSAMATNLVPVVLRLAIELRWTAVMPLLCLSKACSLAADDSLSPVLPSVIKVFGIEGIVRDYIAPYLMRTDIIIRDPEEEDDEEPDDVRRRVEAALAADDERNKAARNK